MNTQRPTECPACGHDRLRRRAREESIFGSPAGQRVEEWVCGLCRYEWATPVRNTRSILAT